MQRSRDSGAGWLIVLWVWIIAAVILSVWMPASLLIGTLFKVIGP